MTNNIKKEKSPIRVLMVMKNYFNNVYGTQSQAIALAEALVKKGCLVEFVIGHYEPDKTLKKINIKNNIHAHIFSPLKVRYFGTFLHLINLALFILKNKNRFDIYHVFYAKYDAFVVGILKRFHKKFCVCKTEGGGRFGDMACLTSKTIYEGLDKIKFPKIILKGLYKFNFIVAISSAIEKEIIEIGFDRKKIILIPNAVDTARFKPLEPKSQSKQNSEKITNLLYVGRFSIHKGITYLIEALPLIDKSLNYHLNLVGEGNLEGQMRKFLKENNLENKVTFWGHRSDIEHFYQENNILVLPSVSEGLSCTLLEGMSSGMAVIATRVSGSEDVIKDGENGFLVKSQDKEALADAITKLIKDDELQIRFGTNARKTIIENYSFDIIAEKYINLYKAELTT